MQLTKPVFRLTRTTAYLFPEVVIPPGSIGAYHTGRDRSPGVSRTFVPNRLYRSGASGE